MDKRAANKSLFRYIYDPSDLTTLGHLPLRRGGDGLCLHIDNCGVPPLKGLGALRTRANALGNAPSLRGTDSHVFMLPDSLLPIPQHKRNISEVPFP